MLTTAKGQNKNFDRQDLRGVNLQRANLINASFIKADLSRANLKDANLSKAKLVQTELDEADLTGTTLTGACIEDWGITTDTKLNQVKCKYIFMRLPTKENENRRRKPDNWDENFKKDDFADFIRPIVDTLDLYHNQRVDPRAIAISWKQLEENNPDANLRFASMEVKGENNLLLRLKTDSNANLSKLNAEYFSNYNQYKNLSKNQLRALLIEKNIRIDEKIRVINRYENVIRTALSQEKSNYFIGGYINMSDGNIYNTENAGIVHNEGEISGNAKVAVVVNEAEQKNLAEAATEIHQLLKKLSKTYSEEEDVVGQASKEIKNNPTLKTKTINALKDAGKEALKEAINHPLATILMAFIE